MSKMGKLLERIRNNPKGISFADLEKIAKGKGWSLMRQEGSHRIWDHPKADRPIPLQNVKGKSVPYQVRQLLAAIDLIEDQE